MNLTCLLAVVQREVVLNGLLESFIECLDCSLKQFITIKVLLCHILLLYIIYYDIPLIISGKMFVFVTKCFGLFGNMSRETRSLFSIIYLHAFVAYEANTNHTTTSTTAMMYSITRLILCILAQWSITRLVKQKTLRRWKPTIIFIYITYSCYSNKSSYWCYFLIICVLDFFDILTSSICVNFLLSLNFFWMTSKPLLVKAVLPLGMTDVVVSKFLQLYSINRYKAVRGNHSVSGSFPSAIFFLTPFKNFLFTYWLSWKSSL